MITEKGIKHNALIHNNSQILFIKKNVLFLLLALL